MNHGVLESCCKTASNNNKCNRGKSLQVEEFKQLLCDMSHSGGYIKLNFLDPESEIIWNEWFL